MEKNSKDKFSELMLVMANTLTVVQIVESLSAKTSAYLANPTEDNKLSVEAMAMLFMTKSAIDATKGGGIDRLRDSMNSMREGAELIDRLKGNRPDTGEGEE